MNENEIWIYDIIGFDESTTKMVAVQQERADQTKPLTVRINSDGGIVTEGYGIYNTLRRHKAGVIVEIDGIAASAASLIAMAGDTIRIADGAFLMIHQCWGAIIGNKEELPTLYKDSLARMENIDATMIKKYSQRSGVAAEKVDEMLRAETWLTSDQAIEMKFADEIMNQANVIPFIDEMWTKPKAERPPDYRSDELPVYTNVPQALLVPSNIAAQCRHLRSTAAGKNGIAASAEAQKTISQLLSKSQIAASRREEADRKIKFDRKVMGV